MSSVKDNILMQCRRVGAQVTPLREQVLDMVLQLDGVIKAYTILAQMQRESSSVVAPPTAYRALDFWAEQGVLHKIPAVNGYVLCSHARHECGGHCDADHAQHQSSFILVCTECGSVDEQSLNREWQALREAAQQAGFAMNEEHVVLTGICAKCRH
ncbi:Fur family transcriptional regulator [Kingella kingae]|uniref:Fur family transcriptional regulator n=1 Tax=Kingella kingae TaxID=504 RepID=UPI000414C6DB|nr:Fur family transcriptional regulator [Kingella kingae]MBD3614059.1 transcriptional repressor [Kingella kingae]MBD3632360.1 transcriptional repressor [Kingella kingae]MBD3659753.1 transcriptional repressor [Kingella kingae]MDK4586127.1 Fur family transcriptional regulator [Kingella kingae]MDK4604214.1 Fur family transcriptional regulator [Kingella kingae]